VSHHAVQSVFKTCEDLKLSFANEVFYSDSEEELTEVKTEPLTNKVVLVKPIEQDSNRPIEFFMKPLEGFMDNVKHEAVEVESVVVDEIIVTDDIGNEIMLPDDSFSLESAL